MVSWFVGPVVCATADCEVDEGEKKMNHEERIEKLEQIIKENVASISFLRGYIKGLEERLNRLEKPNHS
ncbi:hypothetical protein [Streptococcus sp. ZY19097]|uniref:hypothetical protein n=1 Tax=unclassified Streptococcus TaxID=2608887 RepID=UPI00345A4DFE